jgi:Rad3-related DNA helicase
MFDMDKDWYANKALCALVQTTGRCTRSKTDYAVTYVLDGKARTLISQNKNKLPKHFIERLI